VEIGERIRGTSIGGKHAPSELEVERGQWTKIYDKHMDLLDRVM
jgi:hypothetical protein